MARVQRAPNGKYYDVETKREVTKDGKPISIVNSNQKSTSKNLTSGLSVPKGITSVQTPVDKLKESQIKAQETTKNLTSGLSVPKGITSVQTPSDRLKDSQIKAQDKKVVSEVKPKIEVKKEEEVKPVDEVKVVPDNQVTPSDTSITKEITSSKAYSDLIEAQKAKTISDLDAIKQQALGKIGQQQAAINPQFEAQRAQAATQSMQQARNFAEYMAARGQTNAGITAQAELSRGSGLTRQLGEIGQQQQAAQQDVAMRRSVIEQDYLNKIANATTEAEIQKAAKEYQDLIKQEERTYQESRQTLQREQELADIASSREFAKQQSAEQRQFAREQQQATKDLATFRAGLEPPRAEKQEEYNFFNDPDFEDIYSQIVNNQLLDYVNEQDRGMPDRRRVVDSNPVSIYESILRNRINLVNEFGEKAYKILLDTAKDKLPKETFNAELG